MKRSVHCATTRAAAPPSTARSHDSVDSCASRCRREAPSESRTAISDIRSVDRASSRLAKLAQAIRTTRAVTASRTRIGASTPSSKRLCPRRPSRSRSGLARNRSRTCLLMSTCSGASTSARMLR